MLGARPGNNAPYNNRPLGLPLYTLSMKLNFGRRMRTCSRVFVCVLSLLDSLVSLYPQLVSLCYQSTNLSLQPQDLCLELLNVGISLIRWWRSLISLRQLICLPIMFALVLILPQLILLCSILIGLLVWYAFAPAPIFVPIFVSSASLASTFSFPSTPCSFPC